MEIELNKNEIKDKDKGENYKSQKKLDILSNKAKNYLINLISYLMNNKNDFEEKIKPSDLEFKLETNSDISFINQLVYKLEINYSTFNTKRDIVKNIKKYKDISLYIKMNDEYYSDKLVFQNINLNIFPNIKKGITLDLSLFPFYTYNKEKRTIEKFKFLKNSNKNINCKFKLFIYVFHNDETEINKINSIIEDLNKNKNIWEYFENIYVIFQIYKPELILNLVTHEKINKYIFMDNSNQDNKIIFLFNSLKNYENEDNLINIFQNKQNNNNNNNNKHNKDYFFIMDQNNKIVKLKKLGLINDTIYYFLFRLKGNINNSFAIREKKINKQNKLKKMKDLLFFISKLKKLDYIFDINFSISINITINDDLTDVKLKKINSLIVAGEFINKEHKYLLELFNDIRQKDCTFNAVEIPTIDIDIDFTNMNCNKCKKIIPDNNFLYYCYICKIKYCVECVQQQLKNSGKDKYIDEKHNLIFFKTRDKSQFLNLEKSKLGNNKFAKIINNNDFDNKHNAECSGCKGNFLGTERYICLKCKRGIVSGNGFIDYCGKCIENMCNNKEEMEKLEKKAKGSFQNSDGNQFTRDHRIDINHKHEEHIYLMLPLQIKNVDDENQYFYY